MYKNRGAIRNWWESIDSVTLILVFCLISIGGLLITTASPPVAERLSISSFHFAYRQYIFLAFGCIIIVSISTFSERSIKRFASLGFFAILILMCIVLVSGEEIKGAKRWVNLLGFSLQPSEFLKPFYAVVTAVILARDGPKKDNSHFVICLALHVFIVTLLLLQPDFGMTVLVTMVTVGQLFLAGLPLLWLGIAILVLVAGMFGSYIFLSHVAKRFNSFLNSSSGAGNGNYQVEKSIQSYKSGGLMGKGPGEGSVKGALPDSHTDFIFSVAGEEFGIIFCIIIICIFLAIIVRGFLKISNSTNPFKIYACAAVLIYFAIQSLFNIGVTLHLFPTKGMTLPFISYGGSSTFSMAIAFGIYFSLTKQKTGMLFSIKQRNLRK